MFRIIFLFCLFVSILSTSISAQNDYHEKVVQLGLNIGIPLFSSYVDLNATERTSTFSVGGLLNFDFSVIKQFSLGLGFAYQKFNRRLINHRYVLNSIPSVGDVDLTINGFNTYGRGLWHFHKLYERSDDKLDLYVGGGTGLITYIYQSDSPSPLIQDFKNEDHITAFGILGVRYYPVEHLGISAEIVFPTTYVLSIGVNYRFNWQAIRL